MRYHVPGIPFVFHDKSAAGPLAANFEISSREVALSATMARAWKETAASGKPGGEWAPYAAPGGGGGSRWLVFGDDKAYLGDADLKTKACDFWDMQASRAATELQVQYEKLLQY